MKKKPVMDHHIKHFLANGPAVFYTCRAEGDFGATFISPNVEKQLGYSPEDFISDPMFWLNNIHPDDKDHVLSGLASLQENKQHIHEYRFKHSDGVYIWMHDELMLVNAEDDRPTEIIGYWSDVTETVNKKRALEQATSELEVVFQSTLDAIITMGSDGNITMMNRSAEAMFGYDKAELIGRSIGDLLTEPYRAQCQAVLSRLAATEAGAEVSKIKETTARACDGRELNLEVALSTAGVGDELIFIAVMRDVSGRKQVELLKDEFISVLNHELRTPLTAILGAIALIDNLERANLNARTCRLVDMAVSNTRRLTVLMDELLNLESVAVGKLVVNNAPLSARNLLVDAGYTNNGVAQASRVEIRIDDSDANLMLSGDKEKLLSVLSSFISNAVKFSPEGGVIHIGASVTDEGNVRVYVMDQGPGVSEDFGDKVFLRFTKEGYQNTSKQNGAGIGLSIAKALIDAMGGVISFQNELAGGATFYFELPMCEAASQAANA